MAATRRPIALAAAVATAAALGATAFALPALAADSTGTTATAAAKWELKDGTLDWGFKESFRKYLASPFAGGKITVKDGVTQAAGNGVFTFTGGKGAYDTTSHATDTAFDGSVNFYAHDGVLDITMTDVKVSTSGATGAITADVATPEGTKNDVAVAALDLSAVRPGQGADGVMVFKDIPATLTKAGSDAFNGQYKEGDALDPATLSVTAVRPADPDPTQKPTEKPTEKPTDGPTEKPTDKPDPTQKPTTDPTPSPSVSATKPAAEDGAIVNGTMDWGVRKSFRTYVTGPIANGKVELSGGATASGDGYRFPDATGSFDAKQQVLAAKFGGKVRFLGHQEDGVYTLDLSLTNVRIDVAGGKGKLVADVSTKDRKTKEVSSYTGLAVADLKLPAGKLAAKGGVVTLSGVPATLTADGTKAFGGMYQAGEQLDALTVAVALDKDAQLPGGSGDNGSTTGGTSGGSAGGSAGDGGTVGGGSLDGGGTVGGSVGGSGALASTGSDVPTGALLAASGLVVATGAGVVVMARRRRTTV
ncbi:HtaA domain-containing protein [Streptomyces sp. DT24]|uniref:HtaA domain-containing protein n=1 Tax=Streptomyces sp. DT24 TaxID=3416520 RepID=UPI003CEDC44C